ncbi:MAG TPA: CPBP family intramembrane metalloprotease [Tenuifilaceae bacterium]|nr:CPBP family intramembrane metalloprotease [Bacteroidales bacterium]HNV82542.1 CPBP family intramembrane metalloprotease [Tenuifilaceae bacterium]
MKRITFALTEKKIFKIGILVFIAGVLLNIFLGVNSTNSHPQVGFIQKLFNLPLLLFILIILVIVPFVEELIFRYWTKKKKHSIIFSFFAISIFAYLYTQNIFLTLTVAAFSLYSFIILLKNKDKTMPSMITTSLVFALAHFDKFSLTIHAMAMFATLLGLALILSYIGLRKKFYFCIITHGAYNSLALLPIMIPTNSDIIFFKGESFDANIQKASPFNSKGNSIISKDTIRYVDYLAKLVTQLTNYNNDTIYKTNIKDFSKYVLCVQSKEGRYININELHKKLVEIMHIQSDTSFVTPTVIRINTFDFLTREEPHKMRTTLFSFVEQLREVFDLPFVLEEQYQDRLIMVDPNCFFKKNRSDLSVLLKSHYDIDIYNDDKMHITVITVTY